MTPRDREIAEGSLLLSSLRRPVLDGLLGSARVRNVQRNGTIFLQGEQATAIFIVLEGWVKLYRIAPSGAEAVVGVFTRGRSFGEAVAFRNDTYPVSSQAVTDCRVLRIEAAQFLRLIEDTPGMATAILAATFTHLHALVAQVEGLKARTGAQRVAEFLLELTDCAEGACEVTLPYDKALIAGRLGMKPESLSRAFSKLRDHGVTIKQNRAAIRDVGILRDYAEDDPASPWVR
ncbi:cyclic nucleotide-binding protein [Salipiger aestuarii]|uniref:CRP-like cAMP-binding protein n=1 Tax=Salipiger aestuarii TaxID=568098 RepID=A0A327XKS0_9RHOB|nr:Crp/Fnr family transcriptional regulator [Salipiger aestuarii]KAA8605081.1 cyclic nucleotide-binding protein [Salipiger aestuarii]KAA8606822.1 cyclic nucleotide-binding protein [Salipiger aestuarii]KAB2534853.1 cyclic nucleotide-binding protein [Salipiger aestuarii]RAK08546.1 CRP-like cAMP-binding protein [Salipiger aestuarii]